ncbi:g4914 [Coccomyxa elongata]
MVLIAVSLTLRLLKRLTRPGSLDSLEGRGLINEERNVSNTDPFYDKVMKNVRTVQIEELSKEQIEAARMRRRKDRDIGSLDLENVELPENHPFAIKKQVSKDEEELQNARLKVRRGLPLQDLSGSRGFADSQAQPEPQTSRRQQRQDQEA